MDRHGLQRMYILHYELVGNGDPVSAEIPRTILAGMNNHDMPTFATFWSGGDIDIRLELGFLDEAGAAREKAERAVIRKRLVRYLIAQGFLSGDYNDTGDIIRASLDLLAASPAQEMIVNLEDLWKETHYQNIPGTVLENPNWQHKARYRLEEMANLPEFIDTLTNIDRLRSV